MNTQIAYVSQHGCTEKCAVKLADALPGAVDLVNIKKQSLPDLAQYDTIIIGGSIHAGKIQTAVSRFIKRHQKLLVTKKSGLFLCCMEEGETAIKQFNQAFPAELRQHAAATGLFGGEFNLEKMGLAGKFIVKKIARVEKSISKISEEAIQEFVKKIVQA